MIRSALLFVTLAGLQAVSSAAHADTLKLGYVDLQRALSETEDGRRAKNRLKGEFDRKQKELDERSETLKKEIEDLNKKRSLLPEETRLKKEQELGEKMKQVQEIYMRHQRDLAQEESKVTQPILERMQRILTKIADEEEFTMILDRNQSGLVFARPALDLTNQLIRRYNAGEGGGQPAAAAPKPAAKGGKK